MYYRHVRDNSNIEMLRKPTQSLKNWLPQVLCLCNRYRLPRLHSKAYHDPPGTVWRCGLARSTALSSSNWYNTAAIVSHVMPGMVVAT